MGFKVIYKKYPFGKKKYPFDKMLLCLNSHVKCLPTMVNERLEQLLWDRWLLIEYNHKGRRTPDFVPVA